MSWVCTFQVWATTSLHQQQLLPHLHYPTKTVQNTFSALSLMIFFQYRANHWYDRCITRAILTIPQSPWQGDTWSVARIAHSMSISWKFKVHFVLTLWQVYAKMWWSLLVFPTFLGWGATQHAGAVLGNLKIAVACTVFTKYAKLYSYTQHSPPHILLFQIVYLRLCNSIVGTI